MFKEGVEITDGKSILRKILSKNVFSDLAPCFCFSLVVLLNKEAYEILNLVLFMRIIKNKKLSQRFKDLLMKSPTTDAFYQMIILILNIFFWAHVIAVLWHFVGVATSDGSQGNSEAKNWLKALGIENKDWRTKYLFSIYWGLTTMLTVGYGDITPTNVNEMLYNIFAMFVGCCIFGYSMNKIGEILSQYQKKKNYLE